MIDEWEKRLLPTRGTIPALASRDLQKQWKCQSGYPTSWPGFEQRISRIPAKNVIARLSSVMVIVSYHLTGGRVVTVMSSETSNAIEMLRLHNLIVGVSKLFRNCARNSTWMKLAYDQKWTNGNRLFSVSLCYLSETLHRVWFESNEVKCWNYLNTIDCESV
jgi:hypothetical protein